jgi:hypothetical protein
MENTSNTTERGAWPVPPSRTRPAAVGGQNGDLVNFRVKVSGDLCYRGGYVQNDKVKKLVFTGSSSRVIRLAPGNCSLTVFVGADSGKTNVDYALELITDPTVSLHVPWKVPFRARTVGITGFIVIDFTLHWTRPS